MITNQDGKNRIALPNRQALPMVPALPCAVGRWQEGKHSAGAVARHGSGLPVATITIQPDRQGQDSFRRSLGPWWM